MSERDDLIAACRAMTAMLRDEYGAYTPSYIIRTWGIAMPYEAITDADADAVERVEHLFAQESQS